jgi:F1F0 ATPase subunit 2
MSNAPYLLLALFAGIVLGAIFFGGLWWTIRKGVASKQPALWFAASLILRTAITLTGFYYVTRSGWPNLLACLVGFALARIAVTRFANRTTPLPARLAGGTP